MTAHFKHLLKSSVLVAVLAFVLLVLPNTALAQITNPAISPELGGSAEEAEAGIPFARYFVTLWRGVITVGGLMILIYMLWGGIEWITAGGDSAKVNKARDRMTQAIVGFIILVSTVVIVGFIGAVFFGDSFNFFQLSIPSSDDLTLPESVRRTGRSN